MTAPVKRVPSTIDYPPLPSAEKSEAAAPAGVDGIVFRDLREVIAKDVVPAMADMSKAKMSGVAQMLVLTVAKCPWGDPSDINTWMGLHLDTLKAARDALGVAHHALEDLDPEIKIDLSQVTAAEYDEIMTGPERNRPEAVAKLLAKFVVRCPEAWGKPDDPATYLKLRYYMEYEACHRALLAAGSEELENFLGG